MVYAFEDCEWTIVELKLLFFQTLFDWVFVRVLFLVCLCIFLLGFLLLASSILLYSYELDFIVLLVYWGLLSSIKFIIYQKNNNKPYVVFAL